MEVRGQGSLLGNMGKKSGGNQNPKHKDKARLQQMEASTGDSVKPRTFETSSVNSPVSTRKIRQVLGVTGS
jgi:hypothetical protein